MLPIPSNAIGTYQAFSISLLYPQGHSTQGVGGSVPADKTDRTRVCLLCDGNEMQEAVKDSQRLIST